MNTELLNEIESYIQENMKKWKVPGLAISVVKDGDTILSKGYGTREVGKDLPVDEDTLFAVCGSSQSFTASGLAMLVDEGKMEWNAPMVNLLPCFRTSNNLVTNSASVVDALSNRIGLDTDILSWIPHPEISRCDLLKKLEYASKTSDFRTTAGNSFLEILAAAEVISALSGINYDEFIHDRLFQPLGMMRSVMDIGFLEDDNLAMPHEPIGESNQYLPVERTQSANVSAVTGAYSTVADMAKWLKFQLANEKGDGISLISHASIKMMRTGHSIVTDFPFPGISKGFLEFGIGYMMSDSSSGHKIYSNGGDTIGFESFHAFVPELNLGIAVMCNSTQVIPQPLVAWIIDRFSGAPREDWIACYFDIYGEGDDSYLEGLEQERLALTDASKKTSLPIEDYVGTYSDPLLGEIVIEAKGDQISYRLGTFKGNLLHANSDTFFIQADVPRISRYLFKGAVQFRLDQSGNIATLVAADRDFKKIS